MAQFFVMPQASPTMEVGTILSWRVEEGARLSPQDVIAEVETDKAAMEIEVFDTVYLLKILVPAGEEVAAGRPIAILGERPDEDVAPLLAQLDAQPTAQPAAAQPATAQPAAEPAAAAQPAVAEPTAPADAPAAAPAAPAGPALPPPSWHGAPLDPAIMEVPGWFAAPEPAAGSEASADPGRVRSSPAARRAARERGLDLHRIPGTGPRGRVTAADVEQFLPGVADAAAPAAPAAPASHEVRNSQMRKTIARRLKQAWQEAPVFYLTARYTCDALVAFRSQLKEAGVPVSYNDLIVKAVARALRDVPECNASWGEQAITRHDRVHVGVAVAIDDGLITPVLRDADTRGLADLAAASRDLATRARDRKLQPEEYQGSTFTVSNLGMMGIEHFTAILNPPEAAILAVGGMQQEPVVVDGAVQVRWQLRVTMTCDHRVIDGALGARFLQALRRYLEAPALLAA